VTELTVPFEKNVDTLIKTSPEFQKMRQQIIGMLA